MYARAGSTRVYAQCALFKWTDLEYTCCSTKWLRAVCARHQAALMARFSGITLAAQNEKAAQTKCAPTDCAGWVNGGVSEFAYIEKLPKQWKNNTWSYLWKKSKILVGFLTIFFFMNTLLFTHFWFPCALPLLAELLARATKATAMSLCYARVRRWWRRFVDALRFAGGNDAHMRIILCNDDMPFPRARARTYTHTHIWQHNLPRAWGWYERVLYRVRIVCKINNYIFLGLSCGLGYARKDADERYYGGEKISSSQNHKDTISNY